MLTRRGWLAVGGTALLVLGGRVLGVVELYAMAAALAATVGGAVVQVRRSDARLETTRDVKPPRVHAGAASRVEVAVVNRGTKRSPVVVAVDPFDRGRRFARFLLAPLAPGERAVAAYRLPTERRGVYPLGPLRLEREDPFGLASAVVESSPVVDLTVYPRVDPIPALPYTVGHDPLAGTDHPTALGPSGDELYALRPYVVGDDLRRVHWKSTARTGELMIRQDEMPWQGRTTVVVDLRSGVHTEESLELVLSAAASIVTASWRHRSLLRLVATDGTDSGYGSGTAHVEALLERLALARTSPAGDLGRTLASLRRAGASGALTVVTTAQATGDELAAAAGLRARYGSVLTIVFERSSWDPWARTPWRTAGGQGRPAPPDVVRVTDEVPFAVAWEAALTRGGRRAVAP